MNPIDMELRPLAFTRVDWDILACAIEELLRIPEAYFVMPLVMKRAAELHNEIVTSMNEYDMDFWSQNA